MEPMAEQTERKRKADAITLTREGPNESRSVDNHRKRRIDSGERDEPTLDVDEIETVYRIEESDEDMTTEEEEDEEDGDVIDAEGDDDDDIDVMDAYNSGLSSNFGDECVLETEVDHKEHLLGDQNLTFKIFLAEEDGDDFTRWMQTIHVSCSYEGKEIGQGFGRYVDRDKIRDTFWRDMEEPCQELSNVAFEMFDRYGRLRKEFKDHPIQRGTGAWGSELDRGSFFVIEYVLLDKEWRRKTIGSHIVTYLIEKSRSGSRKSQHSLVQPGWLNRDIESEIQGQTKDQKRKIRHRAHDNAASFFRSLGFRRVGASSCFGLATDEDHPARAILQTDDFDPAEEEPELDEDPEGEDSAQWHTDQDRISRHLELLEVKLPLHHAVISLPDSECVEFLKTWKSNENPAEVWTKTDHNSDNILHIAACGHKIRTVRWLIDSSGEGVSLSLARNLKGNTPVEKLKSELETERTMWTHGMMTINVSDKFPGFTPEATSCLAALRSSVDLPRIQYDRLKFGCTCDLCIDGYLSPRMSFALLCQAEITHDMLNEGFEDGETWCMMHQYLIEHVAPDVQRYFVTNKSLRQGFANIFDHAATILRSNRSPTLLTILSECEDASEWPPHTKNFLRRGGDPESALKILFEHAKDQDEWAGDGQHMEVFREQIMAFPECRNDHEFGCVALACGLPNMMRSYG